MPRVTLEEESKVSALLSKIVVDVDKVEEKTKGNIYLPETSKDNEQQAAAIGTVVSVGSSAFVDSNGNQEDGVNRGDRILFCPYAGYDFFKGDKVMRVINDTDVLLRVD